MAKEHGKLQLRSDGDSLGIATTAWQRALETAIPDPVVQIRHAPISGDENCRTHVAAIPDRVGCHFHAQGNEGYAVVKGSGTLYWGEVKKSDAGYIVKQETPVDVSEGDSFIIPEGYAHQLKNVGSGELVIVFVCPDSHLNDHADRILLPALAP